MLLEPTTAHFHRICHGNCVLVYVGGVLEFRKLDFRGLKGQFDGKKPNFRELVPKLGHLKPIKASRTKLWYIFINYAVGIVPQGMLNFS